jgi:hypothetical protein
LTTLSFISVLFQLNHRTTLTRKAHNTLAFRFDLIQNRN